MSEYTVNLSKDEIVEGGVSALSLATVAEVDALRTAKVEAEQKVGSLTNRITQLEGELNKAIGLRYEAQTDLHRFKVQVRDALIELRSEHNISREDLNETLSGLGLQPLVRKVRGTVTITYTVNVDLEDVTVEDGQDEEDALFDAARNYNDDEGVNTYDLEFEDASVDTWEEQDEE